jgi:HK97 family phage prohead protease
MLTDEQRAVLDAAAKAALPNSAFAYIDSKGEKHLPVHDAAHVQAASARFGQTDFESPDAKAAAAKKILAAADKHGVAIDPTTDVAKAARDQEPDTEVRGARAQHHSPTTKVRKKPRHRSRSLGIEVRHNMTELRADVSSDGNTITLRGTPIVYGVPYSVRDIFGEFQETMQPGVATSLLESADTRFLFNHGGLPLARSTSGTLRFIDTASGLQIEADLDARQSIATDLAVAIERGDVNQMSCGFIVARDTWNADETQRSIELFQDLLDVSAVTYPASLTTDIAVAQRMMMEMPVESRARLVKSIGQMESFAVDLRAGKSLSGPNAQQLAAGAAHVTQALQALNTVLAQADPADLPGQDDDTVSDETDTPDADSDPDGSSGGGASDASVFVQDGTGTRTAESIEELRVFIEWFDVEVDEARSQPTAADPAIMAAIMTATTAVNTAVAAQTQDPDNDTDPDDAKVLTSLKAAQADLKAALTAQAVDGSDDTQRHAVYMAERRAWQAQRAARLRK